MKNCYYHFAFKVRKEIIMPTDQTPEVYIEEIGFSSRPIDGVATTIAAFIGETETGSEYENIPTLVTSSEEFITKFGYYSDTAPYMAPAVHSFFLNGGSNAFIVKTPDSTDASIIGSTHATGLISLVDIDEVSIVTVPGIMTPLVIEALIAHCELLKDRIAILDAAENTTSVPDFIGPIAGYINEVVSRKGYAVLYTPWYKTAVEYIDTADNDMLKNKEIFIPTSGAMAGIYARNDSERGVHKVPGNMQVRGALELKVNYSRSEQTLLNPKGINCIREFPGRGILVWGARTIASDPQWKYVSVRRLHIFLEVSIYKGTKWVQFEANTQVLWAKVRQSIEIFLTRQWRKKALIGNRSKDAFFVRCGYPDTMTQEDITNGRLICEIGVATMRPAEFIFFRISQRTSIST